MGSDERSILPLKTGMCFLKMDGFQMIHGPFQNAPFLGEKSLNKTSCHGPPRINSLASSHEVTESLWVGWNFTPVKPIDFQQLIGVIETM